MFLSVAQLYQEAINNEGYNFKRKYDPISATTNQNKRSRKEEKLWFNLLYSTSVKTNVGGQF